MFSFSTDKELEDKANLLLWGEDVPEELSSEDEELGANYFRYASFLLYTGIKKSELNRIIRRCLIVACFVFIAAFVFAFEKLLLAIPVYLAYQILALISLERKRSEEFEKDYVPFLIALASGIRTGLDPIVAFSKCGELYSEKSLLRKKIVEFENKLAKGVTEDEAFISFADDIKHPDLQLFRSTMILARREGSSLSTCLQRLAKVTRRRQSFRRKIKSSLAMQRLSAFGICGCALVVGMIQCASNYEILKEASEHPLGSPALKVALTLIVSGLAWILYMSRRRI